MNRLLGRILMLAVLAAPSAAYSLELESLTGQKLTAAAVPAPSAPVKAAPRACRPFLLAVSVGGVNQTVVIERACTPENDAVWALTIELRGKPGAAVKVVSDSYPAERAALENRIRLMVVEGVNQADADFIVTRTGPALELAAKAAPAEAEKILAEAAKALKDHLAKP
jgi:hypothetical protein